MSKGISPLIASVLLLAVTISIGTLAGNFFAETFSGVSSGASDAASQLSDSGDQSLEILEVEQNEVSDTLKITFQNTGDDFDSNGTATAVCEDGEAFQEGFSGLNTSQIEVTEFEDIICSVEEASVSLEDGIASDRTTEIQSTETSSWLISSSENFEDATMESENIFFGPRLDQEQSSQQESENFQGSKTNITEEDGVLKLESE